MKGLRKSVPNVSIQCGECLFHGDVTPAQKHGFFSPHFVPSFLAFCLSDHQQDWQPSHLKKASPF
jgi:hypothetical protein